MLTSGNATGRTYICSSVDSYVQTNPLIRVVHTYFETSEMVPGDWRNQTHFTEIGRSNAQNYTRHVKRICDNICQFFCSEQGSVPCQVANNYED